MNKKQKMLNDGMMVVKCFFAVCAVLLLLYFVIGQIVAPDERDASSDNCRAFETQWYHVLEDGTKEPVEVPGKVSAKRGEKVTIITTLPDKIEGFDVICFRPVWQDLEIYIDGELRADYSTKETRLFGTNSAFRYVFVSVGDEDAGKELAYCITTDSKYAGTYRKVLIGDKSSIWAHLVKESGFKTVVAMLLMGICLFCVIACSVLRQMYKKNLSLNYLAWSLFYCSLWMLSETEFRQLLFHNVSVLTSMTYWSLMLIPFPFLIYMDDIQEGRYRKLYLISMGYSMVVAVVGTILQLFDVMQFVEQLPFIHGGIGFAMACIIGTILVDAFRKNLSGYFFVGLGIYGMLFFAILELLLYYINSVYSLGSMLMIGLLFLLIMAIIKTGQDLFASEEKKKQAIIASKAQAQFLASMSHEIRTPINAVIGMNEMIIRESQNETIQEYAHNIKSSSNMLLGLVNDVLDFSKIESGQLELVMENYNLASLIKDEMVLLNARAAGKAISTQMEVADDLPSVLYGDELRIKQIVTNLLSNAVKYTKEGTVTFGVSAKWKGEDQILLSFEVRDTGVGIRQEDIENLFSSFKRLELEKNRHIEGTGLGLNIAKSLVEQMNGSISVDSKYGKGSTFIVTIPQTVVDKTAIDNVEEAVRKLRSENMKPEQRFVAPRAKILVVDDNKMNLTVIGALLKRTKMQVDFADSGMKCLEMTKEQSYDIILMDHMMPEMDGIETLKKLREDANNPNQKAVVVALTANAIAGCREMYLEHGFDNYCSKPVKAEVLDTLLVQHLSEELVQFVEEAAK
ncbi:MAG: response regulator [Lachnospiraceae bacterium]|nr:response regulator [Lachnospiraceae bacterium]